MRRTVLLLHVLASVGWLGAALVFVALAGLGLTSDDTTIVRGAYRAMEPLAWWTLVPLAIATLATGLLQSAITTWGLLFHYWVVFKLVLTLLCTGVLLMYMRTFEAMADVARSGAGIEQVRNASPALHATLAVIALVMATVLAIYKPKGRTKRGRRALRSVNDPAT